ncbi:hypothetical protein [Capnocytophaga cynodegmi]|uniref:hypothetical protein n=1 Tax=Capnocytophaga cynodegmi TaxID=28189 RepID=UPI00385BAD8A
MKKLTLLLLIVLFSCQEKVEEPIRDPYEDYIEVDYITDTGFIKDFFVKNGEVYMYREGHPFREEYTLSINKIDKEGNMSIEHQPNGDFLGIYMGLTLSGNKENFFLTTGGHDFGNGIYKFSFDYQKTDYKIPSFGFDKPRIPKMIAYDENSYLLFDSNNGLLLRFFEDSTKTLLVAGLKNQRGLVDGIGVKARFREIYKRMVNVDKVVYAIDGDSYLRRIQKATSGDEFEVKTLVSNFSAELRDLAVDSKKNVLVLADNIYKLNINSNTLERYYDGKDLNFVDKKREQIKTNYGLGSFDNFFIEGKDLYLYSHHFLMKISDYETKLKKYKVSN